ncbi:uncharacterized protein [Parasteatoda tepidariorum]|uniref:uncharacterized protein isoform X2 n=1 Tax=Parasteatoda tepidariorum TaxID=114398 RepID=UPI0039BD4E74
MRTSCSIADLRSAKKLHSLSLAESSLQNGYRRSNMGGSLLHLSSFNEFGSSFSLAQDHSKTLSVEPTILFGSSAVINSTCKKTTSLTRSKDGDLNYCDNSRVNRWFDGLLRCLKPVWTVLGKSTTHELKEDNWEILFDDIKDLQFLGSGAQGAVFCGHLNGELVAVKKVREKIETDIKHLKKLSHCNVVAFRGVCVQPPCYCIIMEYCPAGTLHNLLRQGTEIPPKKVMEWSKQVANGMNYLHIHKIIHRDLKSENILIGYNDVLKISDFGTSRQWNDKSVKMSFAGTVAWMAPEVIRNESCSEKVDIWSGKPRNRPSFRHILMHLDIAAVEILSTPEEEYFQTQATWKVEIGSYMQKIKNDSTYGIHMEEDLIKQRQEELKHAQDIREHYEKKLERVNNLYLELATCLFQVEQREQELIQREQGLKSGITYSRCSKKNIRRFLKNNRSCKKRSQKPTPEPITAAKSVDSYSAFHGSAKSRIRRAKNVRSGQFADDKFDYSVPPKIIEEFKQDTKHVISNVVDSETQTDLRFQEQANDLSATIQQSMSISDDFTLLKNTNSSSSTLDVSVHNSYHQSSIFTQSSVIKSCNQSYEQNAAINSNEFECHKHLCALPSGTAVNLGNYSHELLNMSEKSKRNTQQQRFSRKFCRMGSFRGKLLLKRFGSSLQEFSATEESCDSDDGRDSPRHSQYSLANISENSLSSSDEYFSEEENTSEHSSSQYTAGELMSSISNPDIPLNIELESSDDDVSPNQKPYEGNFAQSVKLHNHSYCSDAHQEFVSNRTSPDIRLEIIPRTTDVFSDSDITQKVHDVCCAEKL